MEKKAKTLSVKRSKNAFKSAERCLAQGDELTAVWHMIAALKIWPSNAVKYEDNISGILVRLSTNENINKEQMKLLFKCFEDALKLYPGNTSLRTSLGSLLVLSGHVQAAYGVYHRLFKDDPSDPFLVSIFDDFKNSVVERWHFRMLNDTVRNTAYQRAIFKAVRRQDVVMDIGCGTGLLSLFAQKAGAKKVIAVESNVTMYSIAEKVFSHNNSTCETDQDIGMQSTESTRRYGADDQDSEDSQVTNASSEYMRRLEFSHPPGDVPIDYSLSNINLEHCKFTNPMAEGITLLNDCSDNLEAEKLVQYGNISLIITEIFDAGLFGEGVLQTLIHAWKKILKDTPGARVIPAGASLFFCGIQSDSLSKKYRFVPSSKNRLAETLKMKNMIIHKQSNETYDTEDLTCFDDLKYVTRVEKILDLNFADIVQMEDLLSGNRNIDNITLTTVTNDVTIDAYVMWFELHLDADITITTDPRCEKRSRAWEQTVFFLNVPKSYTENGSIIDLKMNCRQGRIELLDVNPFNEAHFAVSKDTLNFLNDCYYIDIADGGVGICCVHMSAQGRAVEGMRILDLTPFPIMGLFFLQRGVEHMTCLASERGLILNVAAINSIDVERITFIDFSKTMTFNRSDLKFDITISYFFEDSYARLNYISSHIQFLSMARKLRPKFAITLPSTITFMGKLIYSEDLNRINRLDDKNAFNFGISEYINDYQVSQNSLDLSMINYEDMSDEFVVFEECFADTADSEIMVKIKKSGYVNAILTWYNLEIVQEGENYSTCDKNSRAKCTVHLLDPKEAVKSCSEMFLYVFVNKNTKFQFFLDTDPDS